MGPAVTTTPDRHLIKKYANRKLYDTRTSRYITLEGIADLVRNGHEIKVVDRDSGHDLTQVTLSQIVLSQEKNGPARLVDAGGEALPPERPDSFLPVHAYLLATAGTPLFENLWLEELARERVYESVLVALPLKLLGSTGVPVRPVAFPLKEGAAGTFP
jgi:kynurenine formamidase